MMTALEPGQCDANLLAEAQRILAEAGLPSRLDLLEPARKAEIRHLPGGGFINPYPGSVLECDGIHLLAEGGNDYVPFRLERDENGAFLALSWRVSLMEDGTVWADCGSGVHLLHDARAANAPPDAQTGGSPLRRSDEEMAQAMFGKPFDPRCRQIGQLPAPPALYLSDAERIAIANVQRVHPAPRRYGLAETVRAWRQSTFGI